MMPVDVIAVMTSAPENQHVFRLPFAQQPVTGMECMSRAGSRHFNFQAGALDLDVVLNDVADIGRTLDHAVRAVGYDADKIAIAVGREIDAMRTNGDLPGPA